MVKLGFGEKIDESIISFRVERLKELAISKKVKVGCVIEGWKKQISVTKLKEDIEYFGASNIEISQSFTYHAEMLALTDCIMHRYYPIRLFVSSQSVEEHVYLCGTCRQMLLEVNEDCEIIVLNPDGTRKSKKTMIVSELLPHHKNVKEKNQKFYEICGLGKTLC